MDTETKFFSLLEENTNKSLSCAWETLLDFNEATEYHYNLIINKWGDYFPLELLKKEVQKENKPCIIGAVEANNEKISRYLFVLLKDKANICDYWKPDLVLKSGAYYSNLLKILFNNNTSVSHYNIRNLYCITYCEQTSDPFEYDGTYFSLLYDFLELSRKNDLLAKKIETILTKLTKTKYEYDKNIEVKRWLLNNSKIFESDYPCLYMVLEEISFREIILYKPFRIPVLNEQNEKFAIEILGVKYCDELTKFRNAVLRIKWHKSWMDYIEEQAYEEQEQKRLEPAIYVKVPFVKEYGDYIISRADDFLSAGIETLMFLEYKAYLYEGRKRNIAKLVKENILSKDERDDLLEFIKNDENNYYAISDKELFYYFEEKKTKEQMASIHNWLEPPIVSIIFEKALEWVVFHKDSPLWETAPWIAVRIFMKSYADRPVVWARNLANILEKHIEGTKRLDSHKVLIICTALVKLRDDLGGRTYAVLKKSAEIERDLNISGKIEEQIVLFNMKSNKRAERKVDECKKLILTTKIEKT